MKMAKKCWQAHNRLTIKDFQQEIRMLCSGAILNKQEVRDISSEMMDIDAFLKGA